VLFPLHGHAPILSPFPRNGKSLVPRVHHPAVGFLGLIGASLLHVRDASMFGCWFLRFLPSTLNSELSTLNL
jgi:hypothetical protein